MIRLFVISIFLIIKLNAATNSFTLENDIFAGTDRHYTNGTFYTYMEEKNAIPSLLDISALSKRHKAFTISQLMFTPENIAESKKILDDSPYAGHIGLTWLYFQSNDYFMNNMGVSIGSVGPVSLAKQTQKAIHKARGVTIPQGWDNQLHTDPTYGLSYEMALKTNKLQFMGVDFDWTTNLRFDYGNFYTGVGGGMVFRFGNYFPKNFKTTGAFIGGHESDMLNMKRVYGFKWNLAVGSYAIDVDSFYMVDEVKEYKVKHIDYIVGDFASLSIYFKKVEIEVQYKSAVVNDLKLSPYTVMENRGAFVFRWKWD